MYARIPKEEKTEYDNVKMVSFKTAFIFEGNEGAHFKQVKNY